MRILCISIFAILRFSVFAQEYDTLSIQFLKKNLVPIESIEPDQEMTTDLMFLNQELEGVEIVLLGEQGHGDGSTFLAKTRVIKFLHEQQGFNVLAFESGLADCYRVWEAIQNGADSLGVFDLGIFPVWAKSRQVQPLFEYILEQSKTDHPLILAGFDMQPTGSLLSPLDRYDEINEFLSLNFGNNWSDRYPQFHSVYENIPRVFQSPLSKEGDRKLRQEIKFLTAELMAIEGNVKSQVMARYLENIYATITLFSKADLQDPSNTPHIFNIRDKSMEENFSLLKEKVYPGEKIIAWGANSHFGYGRALLGSFEGMEAPQQAMIPAGQYLKIDFQDRLYTLAFTSAGGMYGSMNAEPFDLGLAKQGSLERQIQKLGHNYAFLSLRNKELLGKRLVTRAYGHSEMSGVWSLMADGLFFINSMDASEFND